MGRVSVQAPDSSGLIADKIEVRVLVKRNWADEWQPVDYLQPLVARECVAPTIGLAEFKFDYGLIKREDRTSFESVSPSRFSGWYVQIQRIVTAADPGDWVQPMWTGILVDDTTVIDGSRTSSPSQGHQVVSALELSYLLDRVPLKAAVVDQSGSPIGLGRMPAFNRRVGRGPGAAILGNRNASKIGSSYCFGTDGEVWDHYDVCEYLCVRHSPTGHVLKLGGQASELLTGYTSVYDASGKTLKQALDHLISRRRGMGWCLRTSGSGDLVVHVFSTLASPVSVGALTIPANTEDASMLLGSDKDVRELTVRATDSVRYDKVTVRGARLRAMFTVSFADGTLEELWSSTEEAAYEAGTGTPEDESEEHDRERATDKYARVYQAFRIPAAWDWMAYDGEGNGGHNVALSVSADGTVYPAVPAQYFPDDRPLLRHLILAEDTDNAPAGVVAEYRKPLVCVKDAEGAWHQVDTPYVNDEDTSVTMHVRMLDRGMGLLVKVSPNHLLALNHWAGGAADSDTDPLFDYENLVATVCVETDEHLKVEAEVSASDQIEAAPELVIDVPTAHYWYVVPNTVTGVTAGALVRDSAGGAVRDDVERLRRIAALARAWYGQTRRAATIPLRRLEMGYAAGSLVTNVGSDSYSEPVNAIVSARAWDFEKPGGFTTISTDFAELDVVGMVDFPGLSDVRAVARHIRGQDARLDDLEEHVGNLPVRWATVPGRASSTAPTVCRVEMSSAQNVSSQAVLELDNILEDDGNFDDEAYEWTAPCAGVVQVCVNSIWNKLPVATLTQRRTKISVAGSVVATYQEESETRTGATHAPDAFAIVAEGEVVKVYVDAGATVEVSAAEFSLGFWPTG